MERFVSKVPWQVAPAVVIVLTIASMCILAEIQQRGAIQAEATSQPDLTGAIPMMVVGIREDDANAFLTRYFNGSMLCTDLIHVPEDYRLNCGDIVLAKERTHRILKVLYTSSPQRLRLVPELQIPEGVYVLRFPALWSVPVDIKIDKQFLLPSEAVSELRTACWAGHAGLTSAEGKMIPIPLRTEVHIVH